MAKTESGSFGGVCLGATRVPSTVNRATGTIAGAATRINIGVVVDRLLGVDREWSEPLAGASLSALAGTMHFVVMPKHRLIAPERTPSLAAGPMNAWRNVAPRGLLFDNRTIWASRPRRAGPLKQLVFR
jgi:hypothetical protein